MNQPNGRASRERFFQLGLLCCLALVLFDARTASHENAPADDAAATASKYDELRSALRQSRGDGMEYPGNITGALPPLIPVLINSDSLNRSPIAQGDIWVIGHVTTP